MAKQRNRKRPISEINVVPYIDVMLVMLVVFMITAPLLSQGVQVELPQAASEPLDPDKLDPLVLSIDEAGAYYLNIGGDTETAIDAQTLVLRTAAVIRQRPDVAVMVRGDTSVDYGKIVTAMALLQRAGATTIGLMTDPLDEQ